MTVTTVQVACVGSYSDRWNSMKMLFSGNSTNEYEVTVLTSDQFSDLEKCDYIAVYGSVNHNVSKAAKRLQVPIVINDDGSYDAIEAVTDVGIDSGIIAQIDDIITEYFDKLHELYDTSKVVDGTTNQLLVNMVKDQLNDFTTEYDSAWPSRNNIAAEYKRLIKLTKEAEARTEEKATIGDKTIIFHITDSSVVLKDECKYSREIASLDTPISSMDQTNSVHVWVSSTAHTAFANGTHGRKSILHTPSLGKLCQTSKFTMCDMRLISDDIFYAWATI
jgi:hypothetical protein